MKKLILILLLCLLIIPSAEAIFERKEYDSVNKIAKIKSLWGTKIIDVKLEAYDCDSPISCQAYFEYNVHKNKITPSKEFLFSSGYDWYYYSTVGKKLDLDTTFYIETEVFKSVSDKPIKEKCNETVYDEFNASSLEEVDCVRSYTTKEVHSHYEWREIDYFNTDLEKGTYKIKADTKRDINQRLEFIPSYANKKIYEWAWWNTTWANSKDLNITGSDGNILEGISFEYTNATANITNEIRVICDDTPQYFDFISEDGTNATISLLLNDSWADCDIYYNADVATNPYLTTYAVGIDGSTVIMLHGDSTDGNQTFVDSSSTGHTVDNQGDAEHNTTIKKFGTSSIYFDGSADWIAIPDSAEFTLGDAEFTLDFWVYATSLGDQDTISGVQMESSSYAPINYRWNGATKPEFFASDDGAGWLMDSVVGSSSMGLNQWNHIAIVRDNTSNKIKTFINGTIEIDEAIASNQVLLDSTWNYTLGCAKYSGGVVVCMQGYIDEWRLSRDVARWTENFTPPTSAYLASSSATYNMGEEEAGSSPFFVTLLTPVNDSEYNQTTLTFSCSSEDDTNNITDMSIRIMNSDGSHLTSYNVAGLDINNYTVNNTFSSGLIEGEGFIWHCNATNGLPNTTYSGNRTFHIDQTVPAINIIDPTGSVYSYATTINMSLNYSASDNRIDTCFWSIDGGVNTTIAGCSNTTINATAGWHNVTIFVNDTVENINSSTNAFLVNYINYSSSYTTPAIELTSYNYTLVIDGSNIDNASATLYWNGTIYASNSSSVASNTATIIRELEIPSMATSSNITIYWNYTLNDDHIALTTNQTQELINIGLEINATACGDQTAVQLNFSNEAGFGDINQDIDYFVTYGVTSNETINGTLANTHSLNICVSPAWINFSVFRSQFEYDFSNYTVRNYYLFEEYMLDNDTEYITAYNLVNTSSTPFAITVTGVSGINYKDTIIGLLRWYADINSYKLVEMERTSDDGTTVIKVVEEEVDYRIAVYYDDGRLIYMTNPLRMVCYATPCTIDITVYPDETEYFSEWDITGTLTYTNATKTFAFPFNNNDGTLRLEVNRLGSSGEVTSCTDDSEEETGVLSCAIAGVSGIYEAKVYYSNSPETPITILMQDIREGFVDADLGLVFVFLISLVVVLTALWHPIPAIMFAVIGAGFGFVFGILESSLIIGLSALAIVIIIVMKKAY